ncbi:MAG TPA: hypothetical protein VK203_25690 [Nostocaceae cyanobacterium]|nr:hypothetical protein [Nostocaceae cyanobacterium]
MYLQCQFIYVMFWDQTGIMRAIATSPPENKSVWTWQINFSLPKKQ